MHDLNGYAKSTPLQTEADIEFFEHQFPFACSVRLDPATVNKKRVHLNVRRTSEFEDCDAKLAFDQSYRDQAMHQAKYTSTGKKPSKSLENDK